MQLPGDGEPPGRPEGAAVADVERVTWFDLLDSADGEAAVGARGRAHKLNVGGKPSIQRSVKILSAVDTEPRVVQLAIADVDVLS